MKHKITVIGAGAAGVFFAINIKRMCSEADVTILEAGSRPMAKLAVTGGGRCNFTNNFENIKSLAEVYPRGAQLMKRALCEFSQDDCRRWFEDEGIPSIVQSDGCVFPASQDAMQIVRRFESEIRRLGITLLTGEKVESIKPEETGGFIITTGKKTHRADTVLVASGGGATKILQDLDIATTPCVPSLFTFKIPDPQLTALMGITVQDCSLRLCGTSFRSTGTLLITDWGVSGPATLKLSSYAALFLAENSYKATLAVNWINCGTREALDLCESLKEGNRAKCAGNARPREISARLWSLILSRAGIDENSRWDSVGSKALSRLAEHLTNDCYPISGRAKFKEEFVTCGGVSLKEIVPSTLESRKYPGLYFAGEVLDIDAVTGGFNLQAAWSCAYLVSKSIFSKFASYYK